jgi:hypothetical protein
MPSGSGFSVDPMILVDQSGNFGAQVSPVAVRVQKLHFASVVDTGDPSLNALIARLAGAVVGSVGGMGQALQADSVRLGLDASVYQAADAASAPQDPTTPAGHGQ